MEAVAQHFWDQTAVSVMCGSSPWVVDASSCARINMRAQAPAFKPDLAIQQRDVEALESLNKMETKWRLHEQKECKPCAYFQEEEDSCPRGEDCSFCHLCPKGALRRMEKQHIIKMQKQKQKKNARKALARLEFEAASNVSESSETRGHLRRPLQRFLAEQADSASEATRASSETEAIRTASPGLDIPDLGGALAKYGIPGRITESGHPWVATESAWINGYPTSQTASQVEGAVSQAEAWLGQLAVS
eukprot:TRINITY_DN5156_c0_g1_i2.p1 TRINITY_DN5156_c0_g1~~TRINITY_DN5156_c0_g1_i2.p1  ORF type:complete len:247 (+),score=41.34 TRINITY_DN5156_c0_g1_i2:53-793(+)